MRRQFAYLMKNYRKIKENKTFGYNEELEKEFKSAKEEAYLVLNEKLNYNGFDVDYAYGKGAWATVPWFAILDTKQTDTVSKGVYIVYLFAADGESVFLTLNQGTGGVNKAKVGIEHTKTTEAYLNKFSKKTEFNFGKIPDGSLDEKKRHRPQAYEKACIYWKKYSLHDLEKISDEIFFDDLINLADVYLNADEIISKKDDPNNNQSFNINLFFDSIKESKLFYSNLLLKRFIAALITKPFLILTGLSGSGKTKLAQAFVQWICQDESQYKIVPVGADWTNREPLLGYPNALQPEVYVMPDSGVLELILEASEKEKSEKPYFLILDEMNLSQVERYFADFLSVMESKEEIPRYAEGTVENGVPANLRLPSNLFVIGTVNIDETTNMFSPKVLDRANTIEFRVLKDEMEDFLDNLQDINMEALYSKGAAMAEDFLRMASNKSFETEDIEEIKNTLLKFFKELKKTGAEFGYRSASEILRLINQLTVLDESLSTDDKLDIAIMQKLLPKLHGSRRKICPVLNTLGRFCIIGDVKIEKEVFENEDFDFSASSILYPLSLEKIARMHKGAVENGYTSFAEA